VAPVAAGLDSWLKAMLLLLFAYGGYEAALNPMGEAKNPRRDVAFALFIAIAVLTVIYTLLQLIVVGALPAAAASTRPLADVARVLLGPGGALFIAVGALVSVYGYLSANMLTVPRNLYALAERGDFPRVLAAVHPRFHTPYVSIVVYAVLLWAFAQFASFSWNVTLSAVARVLFYGAICAAVPVLRRRQPGAAAWRLPGGALLPVTGVLICAALLAAVDFGESAILLATIGVAFLNWLLVRKRSTAGAG
jgi:amino acid transporter